MAEQKMNSNVWIVSVALMLVGVILAGVLTYGIAERYTDNIKTSYFKNFINSALPVVQYTYDSGKAEYSIISGVKDTMYDFSGIDTADSSKMLASSSSLHKYYYNNFWRFPSANDIIPPIPTLPDVTLPPDSTAEPTPSQTPSIPDIPDTTPPAIQPPNSENPQSVIIKKDGKDKYSGIEIRNSSKLEINVGRIMSEAFVPKFTKQSETPQVLIYHTHTTESYKKDASEFGKYTESWSTDNSKTVVRVGHELDNLLSKSYGYGIMHNSTVHNQVYNESYNKSSITVRSVIKGNPSIKLSIDIHRDGLDGVEKLRTVQSVNGEECARLMFVVGTNETSDNPRWEDNLRLALELSVELEKIAPSIMRYVSIRSSRYNEHIAENGLLVEFGGDGNTVAEVVNSTKYLAKAIDAVMSK